MVYPEEYAGHIVFTASSKRDISVCNNRGNAINATDEDSIYSGQIAHVAIELFPFKIPEKTGISRILQNVFIVGGGERIAITIPIALIVAFIYLKMVGSSLNIISMCSLTVVLRMVCL